MALIENDGGRKELPKWASAPRWLGTGGVLIGAHIMLLALSHRFATDRLLVERPVLALVGMEVLMGLVWLVAVWSPARPTRAGFTVYMIAAGAIMRGTMLVSTPMVEDDFWRYLWDGAVVVQGHSPYAHAPQEFLVDGKHTDALPPGLQSLALDGHNVLTCINHPHLRTIYPPVAQAAFALAYVLSPWNVVAWRAVLLLFDAATLVLLLLLLRQFGLPSMWAAIYWWNPLLIHECVNAAHMDGLALPFVLGAILLATRGKHVLGIASMSCAVGVKLWPLILFPFLFRPLLSKPRQLALTVPVAAATLALVLWPAVHGVLGASSGFTAYAQGWEMNDALFMALQYGVRTVLQWFNSPEHAPIVARLFVLTFLTVWVTWLAWHPASSHDADLAKRMLLALACFFLLSPTQFPWYSLWFLPLLALVPSPSLLLLTVLLPLYRLRFHFAVRDQVTIFDNGIVWLEYLPVWGGLLWETVTRRRHASADATREDAPWIKAERELS